MKKITIEATVNAPVIKIWEYWIKPEHITKWAFASPDWEAPHAENELRIGGKFKTRMQAKDGSTGFDFAGIYTDVKDHATIEYDLEDKRHVKVEFNQAPESVIVTITFDPDNETPIEMQRQGWQAILENFKNYVEKSK